MTSCSFGNGPVNNNSNYVLAILLILFLIKFNQPMNKIRHYVLDISLNYLGVHLVLDKCLKQALCVRYFTHLNNCLFGNGKVKFIRQYVLVILLEYFRDHFVMNQLIGVDFPCYIIH